MGVEIFRRYNYIYLHTLSFLSITETYDNKQTIKSHTYTCRKENRITHCKTLVNKKDIPPAHPTTPHFFSPISLSSIPQYVSASITYSVVSDTATHLHSLPYDLLAVHTSKSKDIEYWAQEEHTHFLFSSSISLSLSFFHTFWLLTLKKIAF